ncbi:NEDD8-conjugating enzyme UBC12 [Clonorchis sinensis]|uniref:NEDD8-conjugating enzyme UBC12 n=1 Tax=Clonorchis sinensis TaxID=79923 RepID=G7YAA3_CLOSI|nr:NEDD8-conjugating enzyme UBC12 [Clonorchis sinensis]
MELEVISLAGQLELYSGQNGARAVLANRMSHTDFVFIALSFVYPKLCLKYALGESNILVENTPQYPEVPPDIRCMTPVFHPNIMLPTDSGRTCINLWKNWNRSFTLLDLANALLYLFYQPNFDDPMNSCVPHENETPSECISQALAGGYVHGVYYASNTAWCKWRNLNKDTNEFPDDSTRKDPRRASEASKQLVAPPEGAEVSASETITPSSATELECQNNEGDSSTVDEVDVIWTVRPRYSNDSSVSQYSWQFSEVSSGGELSFDAFWMEVHDVQWLTELPDDELVVRRYYFVESHKSSERFAFVCGPHEDPRPVVREDGLLFTLQQGRSRHWIITMTNFVPVSVPCGKDADVHWQEFESHLTFKLRPLHWLLQQTRWPNYALPGYFITPCLTDADSVPPWPRASAKRLFADLKNRMKGFSYFEPLHLITIDPLTLSIFAPICNRMINARPRTEPGERSRFLLSIEWLSLWDCIVPPVPNAHARIYHFFGMSVVLSTAFLSNWLGWLSRMELHHFSFGFTRPGCTAFSPVRRVTDAFALSSIYPPSLGCGQLPAFDAWPCVLVWQTSKLLASGLGRLFGFITHKFYDQSASNPYANSQRCGMCPTRVYFAFSDVDEI